MGVGITAVRPGQLVFQRIFPSLGAMPTMLCMVIWTYCGTPLMVAGMIEEYCASSVKSLVCQTSAPEVLLNAATVPCGPPGVQITLLPSTRSDSEYPHFWRTPPRSFIC